MADTSKGGWVTSGKSKAHYVTGFRGGPALCGAMPNNGLWRRHCGLTNRSCSRCRRLEDQGKPELDSATVSGPVARIVLALRRLFGVLAW